MTMFKVNTGCRVQEICKHQWAWEIAVPERDTTVFLIPAGFGGRSARSGVNNRDERLVILRRRRRRNNGRRSIYGRHTMGSPGSAFTT